MTWRLLEARVQWQQVELCTELMKTVTWPKALEYKGEWNPSLEIGSSISHGFGDVGSRLCCYCLWWLTKKSISCSSTVNCWHAYTRRHASVPTEYMNIFQWFSILGCIWSWGLSVQKVNATKYSVTFTHFGTKPDLFKWVLGSVGTDLYYCFEKTQVRWNIDDLLVIDVWFPDCDTDIKWTELLSLLRAAQDYFQNHVLRMSGHMRDCCLSATDRMWLAALL